MAYNGTSINIIIFEWRTFSLSISTILLFYVLSVLFDFSPSPTIQSLWTAAQLSGMWAALMKVYSQLCLFVYILVGVKFPIDGIYSPSLFLSLSLCFAIAADKTSRYTSQTMNSFNFFMNEHNFPSKKKQVTPTHTHTCSAMQLQCMHLCAIFCSVRGKENVSNCCALLCSFVCMFLFRDSIAA